MLRRPRFAVLILALTLVTLPLLGSDRAEAGPTLGISQSYRDFGLNLSRSANYEISRDITRSFSWINTGVGTMRVIVPWDLGFRPYTNGRLREFENWLNRVTELGGQPYVVLGPTEERVNLYDSRQPTRRKEPEGPVAPMPETYRAAVKAFLKRWGPQGERGTVRMLGAWNEPNLKKIDMSIPDGVDGKIYLPSDDGQRATTTPMTSYKTCGDGYASHCGPLMGAIYWWYAQQEMQAACNGTGSECYAVAGEFASAPSSSPEGKPYWEAYANELERLVTARPQIISFHAHRDVDQLGAHRTSTADHDCRPGNESWCITAMFYKWLKGRGGKWADRSYMRIWNTETGSRHALGDPPYGGTADGAQRERFEFLYSLSTIYRVKRLYYFNFQTAGDTDRGLINQGSNVYTAVRPIWQFFRETNCPTDCVAPKHLGSIILASEEPFLEPPLPGDPTEEDSLPPPQVETRAASFIGKTRATLNGSVNPEGSATNYYFEYGPTEAYGNVRPASSAGSGTAANVYSEVVSGLRPGTTYHYRIVASSSVDTSYGEDQTFVTLATPRESDVNGDGRSDLVTMSASGYVNEYWGQAGGTFGSAIGAASGFEPALVDGHGDYPIDVEDVDGDGYDDLVTMHSSGSIGVYPGGVTGGFGGNAMSTGISLKPAVLAPAEGEYEPIAVNDTNGDGRGDLVVLDNVSNTIYTYLGQAQGGFSAARAGSLSGVMDSAGFDGEGLYPIDVADVNGDSYGDLVAYRTNGKVEVYPGYSEGRFFSQVSVTTLAGSPPPSLRNGSGLEPVAVADVNGDGSADFVAHNSNGTLSTYPALGNGLFGAAVQTAGTFDSDLFDGSGSEFAAAIDVNGDGRADLVTAKRADGNIYVHPGQADGSFGAPTANLGGFNSSRVNRRTGWQIVMEKSIRRRQGCRPTGCGIDPRSDVNGDHRSDLATLSSAGNVSTYLGTTTQTLGPAVAARGGIDPAQYDGQGHYPIDVEDINGDAYDDLVTLHSSGTVYTYLGNASGSFPGTVSSNANALIPSLSLPGIGDCEPIGIGDTNGDGRGDLVVLNTTEKTVYTYFGQATGGFSSTRVASLPTVANSAYFDSDGDYFIGIADVNGDGRADLVAQNTSGNGNTYLATGNGVFATAAVTSFGGTMNSSLATGSGYEPIAVTDVNGDGRADLVTHHSSGPIYTYLGQFDGSFSNRVTTPGPFDSDLFDSTGSELGTVIDANGDGFGDLIWASGSNSTLSIQLGRRDGSFSPTAGSTQVGSYTSTRQNRNSGQEMINEQPLRRRSPCRQTGCGLDPKYDVDGDHRADVVALHTSGTVRTYRGQVAGIFRAPVNSHEGELDPAQYDGTGYYPISVDDINGDGRDDLVSMHSSGTVYTFLGQGDGTVTTAVTSLTGALAPAVLWPGVGEYEPIGVGDTTGDRRGDLVLYNNYDRTVYTYPGQASGGFSSTPTASLTLISGTGNADSALFDSVGDYFVDVADVTGDGLADLVAQNTNGNGETYVATSGGEFQGNPVTSFAGTFKTSLATGSGHEPIAVADVNGDGRADFVTHTGTTVNTHLGQASGSFAAAVVTSGSVDSNLFDGTGVELGTVIDVNGDGFGDLVTSKGDGRLYVQKGRRDGTFGTAEAEAEGSYSSTRHNRTSGSQMVNEQPLRRRNACAPKGCGPDLKSDVDGDHRADLVTLHTSGSAYTYRGQISGDFAAGKASSLTLASGSNGVLDPAQYDGVGYYPLGVEDVNGDFYDDLVALDSSGTISTYTGQLDGGFSGAEIDSLEGELPPAILTATPGKYEPIGLGDANGDGRGDLVVFNNVDKAVYTYPGQANGKFSSARVASLTLASGSGNGDSALFDSAGDYFVGVADVTGDGLADLVAQSTNGNGETYKATGGGGFSATPVISFAGTVAPSLATGTGYEPVAVADVNGDGRADFVTHHSSGTVYTYLGQTSGAFTSRVATSSSADSNLYDGAGSELGTVLDVNGDGFGDLISANRSDGNVYVQLGKRTGAFGYATAQLGGTYVSTRHSQASGQQMVSELPIRRRSACATSGCH